MECALNKIAISSTCSLHKIPPSNHHVHMNSRFLRNKTGYQNDTVSLSSSCSSTSRVVVCAVGNADRRISSVESRFCYAKPIPEERIEKPVGLYLAEKNVGENPPCTSCQTKGAILCATCSGSGLYVDSIMESQGIIVKIRCLGCGGTGNIMCSECGGRSHI